MDAKFFGLLEELFDLPAGELTGGEKLDDLPDWSSLMFVSLIAMVDEEYGVTLAPTDILACADLNALAALVERDQAKSQNAA